MTNPLVCFYLISDAALPPYVNDLMHIIDYGYLIQTYGVSLLRITRAASKFTI